MTTFTKEQEQAIFESNKDILVSASAGSGKTTVLVQRVLEKVQQNIPIESLLIVTFTEAAAAEMKLRIQKQLEDQLQINPTDERLNTQLLNLQSANISTLHAFCLDVIRRFYYVIDLDPSFSLLTDDTQIELLKMQALTDVLNQNLAAATPNFMSLMNNFSGDKSLAKIEDLFLKLYQTAIAKPNYQQWLKEVGDFYEIDQPNLIDWSLFQNLIKPVIFKEANELFDKIEALPLDYLASIDKLDKLANSISTSKTNLELFINQLNTVTSYDDLRETIQSVKPIPTQKPRVKDEQIQEKYQEFHPYLKELDNFASQTFSSYFILSEAEELQELKTSKSYILELIRVEEQFIKAYAKAKQAQNFLDFNDLEQMAFAILTSKSTNGHLAKEYYQNKFTEIMVDEYQDTNPIQEAIIQAVKNPATNNLFMVGDVKQSIYGFRQAEPNLFLEKYHAYLAESEDAKRIIFADNFRSTKQVTTFVNYIFDMLMTPDFGGIDYRHESDLIQKANYPDNLPDAVEVMLFDKMFDLKEEASETEENESFNDDDIDLDYNEIQLVIARIKKMIAEGFTVSDGEQVRPLRFDDIAILTPTRSDNLTILEEFSQHDLPLLVTDAQNYFQTIELTMIMSYLKIIDNPNQDIPLVSVLRSPMYQFTEPELAQIKIDQKHGDFFHALTSQHQDEKLQAKITDFIADLNYFRNFSKLHRISELIWEIFEHTRLLEIVTGMINGRQRRLNLQALYQRTAKYEDSGFKDLYQFITFVNRLQKSKKDLAQPMLADAAENAISLMTIHGSKGLEFPIVFMIGLDKKFNMQDFKQDYIINSHLGVGLTNIHDFKKIDTLMKTVLSLDSRQKLLEEKARVLYVGLTRAKQKLILVCSTKDLTRKEEKWLNNLTANEQEMRLNAKLNSTSFLDLMGPQLAKKIGKNVVRKPTDINLTELISSDLIFVQYEPQDLIELSTNTTTNKKTRIGDFAPDQLNVTNNYEQVEKLFNFQYPFEKSTLTTAYQAVSEIKQLFSDPTLNDLQNAQVIKATNRYLQPLETKPWYQEDRTYSAAEIGTATHLILQKHDFALPADIDVLQKEIQTLIKAGLLTKNLAEQVNVTNLLAFLKSDLANLISENMVTLQREVSFSMLINAAQLFSDYQDDTSKILIHGTIDGFFETKNGIILFDYKTDYLNPNNLAEDLAKLTQKYQGQLRLYEQAINDFSEKKVVKKYLIALAINNIIEVN